MGAFCHEPRPRESFRVWLSFWARASADICGPWVEVAGLRFWAGGRARALCGFFCLAVGMG